MALIKLNRTSTRAQALAGGNNNKLYLPTDRNSLIMGGKEFGESYEEITYSSLKSKRDNSTLVRGRWYRITDYVTTTAQAETQSAGHQFDIIVRADDVNKLNENAYAALQSGDTYFSNAGAKLEAWQLKYCLDNDTTRFAWADTTNGKGVIWYMKDEWDNECSYDFKNIMFKRYKVTACNSSPTLIDTYLGLNRSNLYYPRGATIDSSDNKFVFTFNYTESNTEKDYSLTKNCYGNVIERFADNKKISLNNIVFENVYAYSSCYGNKFNENCYCMSFGNSCYFNTFGNQCNNNTFGNSCINMTFGVSCNENTFGNSSGENTFEGGCNNNTFGASCYRNTFGRTCSYSTFGSSFQYNTLASGCKYNTFGNSCSGNTLASGCNHNTFGNNCSGNTLESQCNNNTFGNSCSGNTLESQCYYNTFGNSCSGNTLESQCDSNIIGNYCSFNTFGNSCSGNTFGNEEDGAKDNYSKIIIECGVQDLYIDRSSEGSGNVSNIKICQGMNGKTIRIDEFDNSYQIMYKNINSIERTIGGLYIWFDDFEDEEGRTREEIAEEAGYNSWEDFVDAYIENPDELGANKFRYTGNTIEYNSNVYYLWEFVQAGESTQTDAIPYLITDTIDFDTLYNYSLEHDYDNSYCPYIALLGEDMEEYRGNNSYDWLVKVVSE